MASNMFLFWGSGSIPCWKPMLVLEEKGLGGYPNKLISFSNKEHKGEDVIKLNPRGQVPTFRDGDVVVNESTAICEYLERKYSNQGTQLIPSSDPERAQVLQRTYETSNLHDTVIKEIAYYVFMTKELDQKVLDEKITKGRAELEIWEKYMSQIGDGGFIASRNFSMADVHFFPYLAFCVRLGLNLSKFPALAEYYNRVKDRASVKNSWPPHWNTESSKITVMSQI